MLNKLIQVQCVAGSGFGFEGDTLRKSKWSSSLNWFVVDPAVGVESMRMMEEAAAAADKLREEDELIERAQAIYKRRNTKQLPMFPEPKRGKAHWDHVLEEMTWMAKEFSKYVVHQYRYFLGAPLLWPLLLPHKPRLPYAAHNAEQKRVSCLWVSHLAVAASLSMSKHGVTYPHHTVATSHCNHRMISQLGCTLQSCRFCELLLTGLKGVSHGVLQGLLARRTWAASHVTT